MQKKSMINFQGCKICEKADTYHRAWPITFPLVIIIIIIIIQTKEVFDLSLPMKKRALKYFPRETSSLCIITKWMLPLAFAQQWKNNFEDGKKKKPVNYDNSCNILGTMEHTNNSLKFSLVWKSVQKQSKHKYFRN